jgi:hypothetical protein
MLRRKIGFGSSIMQNMRKDYFVIVILTCSFYLSFNQLLTLTLQEYLIRLFSDTHFL